MLKIALTGGLATGKSHVLARVGTLGLPTIDADIVARETTRPGEPAWREVHERFGDAILQHDGSLDRQALASIVFSDEPARRDLEHILHPPIYATIAAWLDDLAQAGAHRAAVADIPLLYETGHDGDFDKVVVVACAPDTQLRRGMARDGLDKPEAQRRIATQLPLTQKAARADIVISTEGTLQRTNTQVDRLVREMSQAT